MAKQKELKNIIAKLLLENRYDCRDDDTCLYVAVLDEYGIKDDLRKHISAYQLLLGMTRGVLAFNGGTIKYTIPNIHTVRRYRSRLQQLYPVLRGKLYIERMLQQDEVKDDLGYATTRAR